ncbi:MAG: hypothetical protein ACOYZ7_15600 [Chloroflexota bacterium]
MALEVWYKTDIQNALSAAEQASEAAMRVANRENDPFLSGYQVGFRSALVTLALAFGLAPASLQRDMTAGRRVLAAGWEEG